MESSIISLINGIIKQNTNPPVIVIINTIFNIFKGLETMARTIKLIPPAVITAMVLHSLKDNPL